MEIESNTIVNQIQITNVKRVKIGVYLQMYRY